MKNLKKTLEYTKKLNVLYVEDDTRILKTTAELFGNFFNSVDIAEDGQMGLDKYLAHYEENQEHYDLVITDVNMPGLTGTEMSEKILSVNPVQSIVIITAHNEIEYLSKAIELGINGFLTKPLSNEKLFKIFHKISFDIHNAKIASSYVQTLENKNKELEKSLRMLDTLIDKKKIISAKQVKQEQTEQEKYDEEFLREQIKDIVANDLEELDELLTEIDVNLINVIDNVDEISNEQIALFVKLFSRYSSILRYYNLFDDLGYAIHEFAVTMNDNPLPDNSESIKNIFIILESFIYMLNKWQKDISSGDKYKLLKFDASIISDINTISNMWIAKEEKFTEEDLDSVFDF